MDMTSFVTAVNICCGKECGREMGIKEVRELANVADTLGMDEIVSR